MKEREDRKDKGGSLYPRLTLKKWREKYPTGKRKHFLHVVAVYVSVFMKSNVQTGEMVQWLRLPVCAEDPDSVPLTYMMLSSGLLRN